MKSFLSSIALATALSGWATEWTNAASLQKKTTDSTAHVFNESESISPQLQAIIDRNNQTENNTNTSKIIPIWAGLLAWAGMLFVLNRRNKKEINPLETYEKNIPEHQAEWWNALTDSEKYKMITFWPEGIHGTIKQWQIGDCYLQAILVSLKNNPYAYIIFSKIIAHKDNDYEVTFGRQLSLRSFSITKGDIADTYKAGYTGQIWDHIITRAYYRLRSDEAKSRNIKNPSDGTMLPDENTWKRIFEWWSVANTYYKITWYALPRQSNMDKWMDGSSIGTFSYHYKNDADNQSTILAWADYENHAYIIDSFDREKWIINYSNPHDSSKKQQMSIEHLLKLPGLYMNYSEFGML